MEDTKNGKIEDLKAELASTMADALRLKDKELEEDRPSTFLNFCPDCGCPMKPEDKVLMGYAPIRPGYPLFHLSVKHMASGRMCHTMRYLHTSQLIDCVARAIEADPLSGLILKSLAEGKA